MKYGKTLGVGVMVIASMGAGQVARGSSEQVKRGEATYLDECARCHSETLAGTEFGPALVGNEFVRSWAGKNVGDMFTRVRETMPVDSPGRLTGEQSVDVIAFILHENTLTYGDQPLPPEAAALKRIMINAMPIH
jgi:cytochrome c